MIWGYFMKAHQAVAERILELCKQNGISVNALATISAVPPSTLKNIIYGVSQNPGISPIKKLCDGLEISLPEFFNTSAFHDLEQEIE